MLQSTVYMSTWTRNLIHETLLTDSCLNTNSEPNGFIDRDSETLLIEDWRVRTGERALAVDLQEYVFDQQVEFVIEPVSASGETDLILKDPEGGRLILDDKYIADNASRSEVLKKLSDGFHQVYRYCDDYNEAVGFLVVFVRSTKRLALELEESDGTRFLGLGGKTIYYIEVHISEEPSASRSGQAEEIQISRAELIKTIEN
jgi:hypothetical protein